MYRVLLVISHADSVTFMHRLFKSLILTYKNSPLEIREQAALNYEETIQLLRQIKDYTEAQDVLILSTCNRTEIYYAAQHPVDEDIIKLLAITKNIPNIEKLNAYFLRLHDHQEAMQHLFEVAMGLESQVVGDMQIGNQVKQAYQASANEDMAGPFLHRLMHTIFFTNKRVVQETAFRDGAASVSYAASEMVKDLAAEWLNPKVLLVGLGEIGADVCKNLGDTGYNPANVTVVNRTREKAEALAASYNFRVCSFSEVDQCIDEADIIVSSVSMPQPLITKKLLAGSQLLSYKYFIDLSVPRSVEATLEEIPGVVLYNIDDIQNKANEALQRRLDAIPQVRQIIAEAMLGIREWAQEMSVSPTIHRLKNALEQIRQEEIARHLKNVSPQEAKYIDKVTKGMMQKIIKLPVLQLKAACKRGEAETLIDVLNDLFNLEKQATKK